MDFINKSNDMEYICEDTVLVGSAKQGDERAFEVLANKYKKLLQWYVRQLRLPISELDDFSQEGLIGLLKAVRSYDGRSSSFSTYASLCIKNSIISAVRKFNRNINISVPYDENLCDAVFEAPGSPESDFIDKECVDIINSKIASVLSEYELAVFEMYLVDMSYSDIAERLNKDQKSVGNAVSRIRKKLKQAVQPYR